MKKLLAILTASVCVFAMAACGSKEDNTLVMATNAEFPPYEFYEGEEIVGIDAEFAAAIAEKLGMELKIEDMVIIVAEDNTEITGPDELVGKKIGVQQGTTGDIYATDDYGDENIERYNKGFEAVQALLQGKIDAVIIDDQPAQTFVKESKGLKILETEYVEEDYALCFKKDSEIVEKVNAE